MTLNREVFFRDPLETRLPNDGVAKVVEPHTSEEWSVLRHELETFVCEGEYRLGIDRILGSYLSNLGRETQPAVWVSGYFGSGKSHLVRVLEILWRNTPLPDGANPQGIANLTSDIKAHLLELTNMGRRHGGLWSAAGTLGASTSESVRLAFLAIVFRGAGLHEKYPQARFTLWLIREGILDKVANAVRDRESDLGNELTDMYVSDVLAESLLAVRPDFAHDKRDARALLRAQYPPVTDISRDEMLNVLGEVLRLKSSDPTKLPLTLVVLDEMQQFVGPYPDRAAQVQDIVEACSSRLGSVLLFVATGQNAIQDTEQLSKIQARFTVQVALSTTDVERVVRQVVLRKDSVHQPELEALLDRYSGEVSKQLPGTRIGPTAEDAPVLVADYPLLPARQRFWERAVRAVDRSGVRSQLRSQLRIAYEAAQLVAPEPLGNIVGGDFLFSQIAAEMVATGMMLRDEYEAIQKLLDGTERGILRHRICATVYLIGKLVSDGGADIGLRATVETLADLLVTDLIEGSARLRSRLPAVLYDLTEEGVLAQVDNAYRLQTGEGKVWEGEYRSRVSSLRGDTARLHEERTNALKAAVMAELKGVVAVQGASKETRKLELSFDMHAPTSGGGIPVWVRDEWSGTTWRGATEEAHALGAESAVITLWLPRIEHEVIRQELAGWLAAKETLDARGTSSSDSGTMARQAMETKLKRHREALDGAIATVLRDAKVFLGGGTEIPGITLSAAVSAAADAAAVRLYPRFKEADYSNWSKVADRARTPDAGALELIGHSGDAATHPVSKAVLDFAAMDGKKGKAIRDHFTAPPFGWPPEAVNAALVVLVAAGALRATQNGTSLTPKQLATSVIANADFRRESVAVSLPQRLAVSSVGQTITGKIGTRDNDATLATEVRVALRQLRETGIAAGGAAPAPPPPDYAYLDDLLTRQGNELLVAVAEAAARLKADNAAWGVLRDAITDRLTRWQELERLMWAADELDATASLRTQVAAIRDQRALLADPDPVPPLASKLAATLREALNFAYGRYRTAFDDAMMGLTASEAWKQLPADTQAKLLMEGHCVLAPAPVVGTNRELLAALAQTSLSGWADRADALPARFAQVASEARRINSPAAVEITLPKGELASESDLEAYLADIRTRVMPHLAAGEVVIV